jgi:hypothetical protein
MPCLQGPARGDGCAARIVRPSSRSGNQRGEELLAASIPEAGLVEEREVNRRIMAERAFLEATCPVRLGHCTGRIIVGRGRPAECGVTEDRVINTSPAEMLLSWSA